MKLSILEKVMLSLMVVVLTLGFIDMASAQEETAVLQTLGKVVQGQCAFLKQVCANCTYVNITRITAPDTSILLNTPSVMTKTDTTYNLTFCNNQQIGQYIVDWKADPDGIVQAKSFNYFVGLTNIEPTESQGILFAFLGFLSLILFGLSLFGAIKLPWAHPRNSQGLIIGINDLKYLKLLLWFFTYLCAIFIAFSFRYVSRVADLDVVANWLNWIFLFLVSFLLPVFIMTIIVGLIAFFDAKKIDRLMLRGIKVR